MSIGTRVTSPLIKELAALMQQEDFEKGFLLCEKATQSSDISSLAHLFWSSYGQCAFHCEKWEKAELAYEKALIDIPAAQTQKTWKVGRIVSMRLKRSLNEIIVCLMRSRCLGMYTRRDQAGGSIRRR